MNKITIKRIPFKLVSDAISMGKELSFKALDRNGNVFDSKDLKGKTILSFFPDINTSVCDKQTMIISKLAINNPNISFLSITTDNINIINKWCAAKDIKNIDIISDNKLEFGTSTGLLIKKLKKLTRGFILLKDNEIIDISMNKEIAKDPDFIKLNEWLKKKN